MIRFIDSIVLAYTKLRVHRVRTGITVGIAGMLFGVILAGVIVVQGVFTSIERFGEEGLNDRSILVAGRMSNPFNAYQNLENESFIKEVEVKHASIVAQKTAAAKKHGISYNASTEDVSPVSVDEETGRKYIDHSDTSNAAVVAAARDRAVKNYTPFDIEGFLKPYPSARVLDNNSRVQATGGATLEYMQDGVETALLSEDERIAATNNTMHPELVVMNQSVVESFINTEVQFDASKGEIPVIIPFSVAESLLGLEKLSAKASTQDRYDRLNEVRSRIGEVTASFCYRNTASQRLLSEASSYQKEFEKNGSKPDYVTPSVVYKPLSKTECAAVEVEKDTRSSYVKTLADKYVAYQKEIGMYPGDPVQYKVTVRAVGVSKDALGAGEQAAAIDVSSMVQSLLGSWLGYDQWVIPPAMLEEVPEKYRPAELFNLDESKVSRELGQSGIAMEEYFIEFDDPNEARAAMQATRSANYSEGDISVYPFGSSALLMDEVKDMFAKIVLWSLIGVGGIAAIILGSIIGRTVAEGRRESAIFRAIGARRSDIAGIYTTYTLLLSLRVAFFALLLGMVIALVVELLFAEQATLGARFAYASIDTPETFHFFGLDTWYVPLILAAIIAVGLIAAVIPIIRSARRTPIKDMRDDT